VLAETDEPGELVTPTGAAISSHFSQRYGPPPTMTLNHIGTGAGTREGKTRPNILRVMIGSAEPQTQGGTVTIIETDLDDATPEQIAHALDQLRTAGALDAHCLPIYMKKGRPGLSIRVLCDAQHVNAMQDILFRETTTFGLRMHVARRTMLDRKLVAVDTQYGPIRIKVGSRNSITMTASPEYEDCRAAALDHGVSLRLVMLAASSAWQNKQSQN
jgi:hypothetical protein